MVQLREKDLPADELYHYAVKMRQITRKHGSLLLINDRIDIAQAVSADGVHLGGHSIPTATARQLLGRDAIIGVSTHSTQEAQLAQDRGADFITFGPVYYTASKARYGQPVGIEKLQALSKNLILPIYALGGIKIDKIPEIKRAGAYGIAAISALMTSATPLETISSIKDLLE